MTWTTKDTSFALAFVALLVMQNCTSRSVIDLAITNAESIGLNADSILALAESIELNAESIELNAETILTLAEETP